MCHAGFDNGKNIESHFKHLLMIKNISSVKYEGWFVHRLKYLFRIEISIHVPFDHYRYSMTAISSAIRAVVGPPT